MSSDAPKPILTTIAICGFRTITSRVEINVEKNVMLIGPNNAGKSSIMDGLHKALEIARTGSYKGTLIDMPFEYDGKSYFEFIFSVPASWKPCKGYIPDRIRYSVNKPSLSVNTEIVGIEEFKEQTKSETRVYAQALQEWFFAGRVMNKPTSADLKELRSSPTSSKVVDSVIKPVYLFDFVNQYKRVYNVPAFRDPTKAEYGVNLPLLLSGWKNPPDNNREKRAKFRRIESLVQNYLSMPDAELSVKSKDNNEKFKTITIDCADGFFDVDRFGSGLQEFLYLISALSSHDDCWITLEEPEVHMHPPLQRKFVDFVFTGRSNGVFMTTHAPAMLNAAARMPEYVSIYNVKRNPSSRSTQSVKVEGVLSRRDAIKNLGATPSDLLMSNYVVWVEGPTDKALIQFWMSKLYPEIEHGYHYQIAIYGGSLLAHTKVNLENEEVDALVPLLKLSPHCAVVMDSDLSSDNGDLKSRCKRIVTECSLIGEMAWVTWGREIENYLDTSVLFPETSQKLARYDSFSDFYTSTCGKIYKPKLPVIQRYIQSAGSALWNSESDLLTRLEELAVHIRKANE